MIATPIWPEFLIPLLKVYADGEIHRGREACLAACDLMQLSDEARAETLDSGQLRMLNRAGWAASHLHRADWIERASRGHYRITEAGRVALAQYADGFHDYASADAVLAPFWNTTDTPATAATPTPAVETTLDPTETIESAVAAINTTVADDILDRLRTSDPSFFEEAVVTLLLAMGYGGADKRGKRIGGTADGGVDGVIDQDALGLDQVYIQAKRYAEGNNVSRETIQAFIGALTGLGATRGVFITSSDFTTHARQYAAAIPTRIVLINGRRLAELMIQHRVGVQVKQTYSIVEIDEDFFE